ncbi:MAG TPA: hypothetical protein DEG17_26415, partial [Cyanobacteria bacterium UBA11149]|nr:hypothetical protein [Cyanobacteria bacterium UBA11149]
YPHTKKPIPLSINLLSNLDAPQLIALLVSDLAGAMERIGDKGAKVLAKIIEKALNQGWLKLV